MRRIALLTAALLLAQGLPARGADVEDLLDVARERALASHPAWRALLHVVPGRLGQTPHSEIPQGPFFLSGRGAEDPAAELEATLRGWLAGPQRGDDAIHCRFPARTRWLADQLGLAGSGSDAACPALDTWREKLSPRGITLIFAEAFMNNPASMFGHTLLRLDVADPSAPRNLLAFAIDFTASTGGDAGPIFMAKGSFGFYPGRFGLSPYYEKLEVYADWQNRDIWEYPLDLDAAEVERVLLHLWELDDIAIPYYFFRQNCSYQLIRLLAVARPQLGLRHGFPVSVIPVDTVRDALGEIGLLGEPRFRASPAAELRVALAELPKAGRRLALELARGIAEPEDPRVAALDDGERAAVLGAAAAAVRYAFVQDDRPDPELRERSYRLLVARSRAGKVQAPAVPRPAVRPDQGHGTAIAELGAGLEDDEAFLELRVRPAFHGLLDPAAGFPRDSTIGVLDTRLRFYPGANRVRLHELVLVELQSNTPRDDFFQPLSWGLEAGLRTRRFPDGDDLDRALVFRAGGSLGLTWAPGDGAVTLYGLALARLEIGSGFDRGVAAGPGVELGVGVETPDDRFEGRLFARGLHFLAGEPATPLAAGLGGRLTLGRRTALLAELTAQHFDGESWLDARLGLRWSF